MNPEAASKNQKAPKTKSAGITSGPGRVCYLILPLVIMGGRLVTRIILNLWNMIEK